MRGFVVPRWRGRYAAEVGLAFARTPVLNDDPSVMAALACGLAAGLDLLDACMLSNYCAGIAVSQVGAAAVSRDELAAALAEAAVPDVERWL